TLRYCTLRRGRATVAVVPLKPGLYRACSFVFSGETRQGDTHMPLKFDAARFTAEEALLFHSQGKPGKLEITPTKPLTSQRDLSLAYSPGVAVPVLAIAK